MALWGKTKISLEDFWVANIGEALQPGNRELFENDIFYTLFPQSRYSPEGGKRFYLDKSGISIDDFLSYVRICHLYSCCACAFIDTKSEFQRFGGIMVARNAELLKEDFAEKNVNLDHAIREVNRAFLGQNAKNIEDWMKAGSEIFGASSAMRRESAAMLEQANVLYSFLIDYHIDHNPKISKLLQSEPSASRDKVALLIAATRRLHDHTRQAFKTI